MARRKEYDPASLKWRMRHFAAEKFGGLTGLAEAMKINYDQLASYSDEEPPGGLTMMKFIEAGGNAHWLIVGEGPMERGEGGPMSMERVMRIHEAREAAQKVAEMMAEIDTME